MYLYYIDRPDNYRINIVRYQVAASNPNILNPDSKFIIAQFEKNQTESNHNGGKIAFGADGYLYISVGDGGGGGDPQGNSQNLTTVFGSMLRIDIDLNGDNAIEQNPLLPNGNYEIPTDNPLVGRNGLDEIFAWGIRNTWKFSIAADNTIWGADVGQNLYEEINIITKGANYGWNRFEANSDYEPNTNLVTSPDKKPIFAYDHSNGDNSITGGYFYRGSLTSTLLNGSYIYGDFASGRVWALKYDNNNTAATLLFRASGEAISTFGEDQSGELYFAGYGANAKLFKLTETVLTPEYEEVAVNGKGSWSAIPLGTNGTVEAIITDTQGTTYVGGEFTLAGGKAVANLATIDLQGNWQPFSTGTNGKVFAIAAAPDGTIYVGGNFSEIGGIQANNIAVWNGTSWEALGIGTNSPVAQLIISTNGTLYVGGIFSSAGGLSVNNIAAWQNNEWIALKDSSTEISGTNNEVRSLVLDRNGALFVGGNFDTAGGISASRIAKWDGQNWSALGKGTSGFVLSIAAQDEYIYAGGNFAIAGNKTVNRIARYNQNTATWESLNFGLSGNVNTIALKNNYLYAGGDFKTASNKENTNIIMNNSARWSVEKGWEALGKENQVGTDAPIRTLFAKDNTTAFIAGGNFTNAGSTATNYIGIWSLIDCATTMISPEFQINSEVNVAENTASVVEGDRFVLSLQQGVPYTITLPSGEVKNGAVTINTITVAAAGIYTFTTSEGCTRKFELVVTIKVVDDIDNDGISDGVDRCENTPANSLVTSEGCAITTFPDNQFTIISNGYTCGTTAMANMEIALSSNMIGDFNAILTKDDAIIDNYSFRQVLTIEDLDMGEYELCISSNTYVNLERCFPIAVTVPEEVTVFYTRNVLDNSITLSLRGSSLFYVCLNDNVLETLATTIVLPLNKEVNNLVVSTDQCKSLFQELILRDEVSLVYTNPMEDSLAINVENLTDLQVEVTLHSILGKILYSETHATSDNIININTAYISQGYFFLRLKGATTNKTFKLVK